MKSTLDRPAEIETDVSLKADALEDLQRAWKAIRRLEDLSDDPAHRKCAGIAVSILDKAFAVLE